MDARAMALLAGTASTTLFVVSYLPMLVRAVRPVTSVLQPAESGDRQRRERGPGRLHRQPARRAAVVPARFYLVSSALMLALHVRHTPSPTSPDESVAPTLTPQE